MERKAEPIRASWTFQVGCSKGIKDLAMGRERMKGSEIGTSHESGKTHMSYSYEMNRHFTMEKKNQDGVYTVKKQVHRRENREGIWRRIGAL